MKLVKRGAEADLYKTRWQNSDAILKIRKTRKYRNPLLDSRIKRRRTIKESQMLCLVKSFGVSAPLVYFVNPKTASIIMQEIPGRPVHDLAEQKIIKLSKTIGELVGTLHKNGVMHGDLTTSNFILYRDTIFVLDFGLAQVSTKPEDHAVDLRLIKEILNSAHAKIMSSAWNNFLNGYRGVVGSTYHAKIIRLVSEIEGRGRYAQVV